MCSPNWLDIDRPLSRERNMISVEPKVPADTTTMSARTNRVGAENISRPLSRYWKCTIQPSPSRSRCRTSAWQKISAPWFQASGR
ncbi:hypothetical protein D3C84_1180130 [compost metagenome]